MQPNRKFEPLYTLIYNLTDGLQPVRLGRGPEVKVQPGDFACYEGFAWETASTAEKESYIVRIKNGYTVIKLAIRNDVGGYDLIKFNPQVSSIFVPPEVAVLSVTAAVPVSTPVVEAPKDTTKETHKKSFNVVADKSSGVLSKFGATPTDEQPFSHAVKDEDKPEVNGLAKLAETNHEGEAVGIFNLAEPAVRNVQHDEVSLGGDKQPAVADVVNAAYASKDWDTIMTALTDQWPGMDFNKRSIQSLKSFEAVVKKYKLSV